MIMSVRLNPVGSQFLIPLLWNLCSESVGHKILRPSWGLQHWWIRVQLPLGWNTYLLFNIDIVNFMSNTDEGEAECIALLIFIFGQCLNHLWMREGWWGGAERLMQRQLKSHLFPALILAKAISMTHSDML